MRNHGGCSVARLCTTVSPWSATCFFRTARSFLAVECEDTKWSDSPLTEESVELHQFMGKDNFPSTLLGTGENWTLMKTTSVTEYLNCEAGKFSKSKGVGVFENDAKDTNIPVEVWRYYLLTNRPEVSDTLFTWSDLQAKLNDELLSNLGNFINRVLSFIAKDPASGYGSVIPDAQGADSHPLSKALGNKVGNYVKQYIEAMEKVKLKQGLKIAMSISGEGMLICKKANSGSFTKRIDILVLWS